MGASTDWMPDWLYYSVGFIYSKHVFITLLLMYMIPIAVILKGGRRWLKVRRRRKQSLIT